MIHKLQIQSLDISMKTCSNCNLIQPFTDFSLDASKKDGYRTTCKNCKKLVDKNYAKKNAEAISKKRKERYLKGCDTERQQQSEYRKLNPEKIRVHQKKYRQSNKGKVNASTRKRQAQKIKATPPWADLEQIQRIYVLCAKVSERTGVLHHVDHIIPLKGKNVCGLHVEKNLRIIPAKMNLEKSNKYPTGY
jgi:hypothetical protein